MTDHLVLETLEVLVDLGIDVEGKTAVMELSESVNIGINLDGPNVNLEKFLDPGIGSAIAPDVTDKHNVPEVLEEFVDISIDKDCKKAVTDLDTFLNTEPVDRECRGYRLKDDSIGNGSSQLPSPERFELHILFLAVLIEAQWGALAFLGPGRRGVLVRLSHHVCLTRWLGSSQLSESHRREGYKRTHQGHGPR